MNLADQISISPEHMCKFIRIYTYRVSDEDHLLGVLLDVQARWLIAVRSTALLVCGVIQDPVQIHEIVVVKLHEIRRHLDGNWLKTQ